MEVAWAELAEQRLNQRQTEMEWWGRDGKGLGEIMWRDNNIVEVFRVTKVN